jgi:two-component system phosphate regulon sensor histidine kinase PhoR
MMNRGRWYINPIAVLVLSIVALVASLFLYIYWYVEARYGLYELVDKFNLHPESVLAAQTWVVIMVMSVLVGIILLGIFTIFIYNQKTFQLYRLQNNFINNFTHELKTPVTSLKLYLETMLKHNLSEADRITYVKYMLADVNRLANNINSILNLAKIESKGFGRQFTRSEIVQTVTQFYSDNKHLFSGCDVRILNPSGQPIFFRIDRALFEMLLMNLMTNAIKYNRSEKPRIDISFEIRLRKLYVRIKDNGIGLKEKDIKHIFNKFYQVGTPDDISAVGSGLGLYLSEQIAKLHKGKLSAHSQGEDQGTVFTLTLPYYNTTRV